MELGASSGKRRVERNPVLMTCHRPRGLAIALVCICLLAGTALAQQPAPAPPQNRNPFESVTPSVAPTAPQPQPPKVQPGKPPSPFEVPKAEEAPKPAAAEDVIEAIEFRGVRRVPQDTLRNLI